MVLFLLFQVVQGSAAEWGEACAEYHAGIEHICILYNAFSQGCLAGIEIGL